MLLSIIGQQNFLMYNFTLPSVIVNFFVILIFDFLSRNVRSFSDRTYDFSSAYNFNVKMINRYINLPFVRSAIYGLTKIILKLVYNNLVLYIKAIIRKWCFYIKIPLLQLRSRGMKQINLPNLIQLFTNFFIR